MPLLSLRVNQEALWSSQTTCLWLDIYPPVNISKVNHRMWLTRKVHKRWSRKGQAILPVTAIKAGGTDRVQVIRQQTQPQGTALMWLAPRPAMLYLHLWFSWFAGQQGVGIVCYRKRLKAMGKSCLNWNQSRAKWLSSLPPNHTFQTPQAMKISENTSKAKVLLPHLSPS